MAATSAARKHTGTETIPVLIRRNASFTRTSAQYGSLERRAVSRISQSRMGRRLRSCDFFREIPTHIGSLERRVGDLILATLVLLRIRMTCGSLERRCVRIDMAALSAAREDGVRRLDGSVSDPFTRNATTGSLERRCILLVLAALSAVEKDETVPGIGRRGGAICWSRGWSQNGGAGDESNGSDAEPGTYLVAWLEGPATELRGRF